MKSDAGQGRGQGRRVRRLGLAQQARAEELDRARAQGQSLGDLLVSWKVINEEQLAHALHRQKQLGLQLGEVLIQQALLDEDTLQEAISYQQYVEEVSRPAPLMPEPA